jgi:hypothetical protein
MRKSQSQNFRIKNRARNSLQSTSKPHLKGKKIYKEPYSDAKVKSLLFGIKKVRKPKVVKYEPVFDNMIDKLNCKLSIHLLFSDIAI